MKIYILKIAVFVYMVAMSELTLANGDPWIAVGSTGIPDEASQANVSFSSGIAAIAASAPAATSVTLRFPVTSTADLNDDGVNKYMKVRFRDNGASARVLVTLRSYNINTGGGFTLLTLDSNNYTATGYQAQSVGDGCWQPSLDFDNFAYFIEATLSRTDNTGSPALSIIQVGDNDFC